MHLVPERRLTQQETSSAAAADMAESFDSCFSLKLLQLTKTTG